MGVTRIFQRLRGENPVEGPTPGALELADKEKADGLAIGGMRNTADTMGRLSYSLEFGRMLGDAISGLFEE